MALHACYSDFVIAGFMKGRMMPLPGSEQSLEESVHEWRTHYPHSCRTTCPGNQEDTASLPVTSDTEVASVSPGFSPTPSLTATRLPDMPHNNHFADINTHIPQNLFSPATSSSTLSPLFNNMDFGPPPASPVSPRETGVTQESFTMPGRPVVLEDTMYIPASDVTFTTLQELTDHLATTRISIPEPNSLRISGSTVSEAAQALVLAIKGTGRSQTAEFSESELVRGSRSHPLTLGTLFQHSAWYFNA